METTTYLGLILKQYKVNYICTVIMVTLWQEWNSSVLLYAW